MNTVWMSTKKGLITGFLLLALAAIIGVPANWLEETTSTAPPRLPPCWHLGNRTFALSRLFTTKLRYR